mgnify:CR=1 FL=1
MGHLEVDNGEFCQSLSQVVNIASLSSIKPEISGVYFSFFKDNVTITATDSFRLAEKNIKLEKFVEKGHSFILPQKSAREIINTLDGRQGLLKIYFSSNQTLFELPFNEIKHPQIQVTCRLIDGEYPNYQDIIPNKFKTNMTVKREDFLNQVKTTSLFSNRNNEVKISINPSSKKVEVSAQNANVGENKSKIPAKIDGDPVEVSFNYKFLVDGLLNIKSSEVVFSVSKEDGPCVLRPVADQSYLYVVMPIKSS